MNNEKSIYCNVCPIWVEGIGCLNGGNGLYWDTDDDGNETELLCNTDTDDPEILALLKINQR